MTNEARIEKVLVFNDTVFCTGDVIRVKTKNEVCIGRIGNFCADLWYEGGFFELDCSEKNKSIIKNIHLLDIKDVTKEKDQ